MDNAYQLERWHDLYVMLGGSSAALAGLLFVAVSLHVEVITKGRILHARAWANTFLIVMLVMNAAFILAPQSVTAVGLELCATSVLFVLCLGWVMMTAVRAGFSLPWRPYISILLNLFGIAAGLSLASGWGGGMYLETVQFLAVLGWVMFGAWGLLMAAGEKGAPNFSPLSTDDHG
jgi:hypothetical protein